MDPRNARGTVDAGLAAFAAAPQRCCCVRIPHNLPEAAIREKIQAFFAGLTDRRKVIHYTMDPARALVTFEGHYFSMSSGTILFRDGRLTWDEGEVRLEVTVNHPSTLVDAKIRDLVSRALTVPRENSA
jgi:hypothetical protein